MTRTKPLRYTLKMRNTYNYPIKLENVIQHYPWGSDTLIPELLGVPNKPATPFAELWMGSHPRGPSKLKLSEQFNSPPDSQPSTKSGTQPGSQPSTQPDTEVDLNSAIKDFPHDFLGPAADRFPEGLPFLFKVLAAAQPLSIQAHPNSRQAREGYAREDSAGIPIDAFERNYRDKNHKPEIICALTPFTAMCGFREPAEIEAWYLRTTPEIYKNKIAPHKNSDSDFDSNSSPNYRDVRDSAFGPGSRNELEDTPVQSGFSSSKWLQSFFENIMNLNEEDMRALIETLHIWAQSFKGQYKEADLISTFYDQHGINVGVQAPLFLNLVELAPGEALYQPAGVLHAYVQGMGVELMANSDNVLRGGLTKKHVDVPELLKVLSFEPRPADILRGKKASGEFLRYPVPIDEFELQKLGANKTITQKCSERTSIEIGICTQGEFRLDLESGKRSINLVRGESFVLPYAAGGYTLSGRGELYLATIPKEG